jgi:hypothetical protein
LAYSACTFTRVREPVLDSVFFAMFSLKMAL